MKDPRKLVLVIDDDRIVIELSAVVLNDSEYRTIQVANAWAGLQLAQILPPAVILCDSSMPHVGGTQLLKLLRADARTAHIPFVLMIGHEDPIPPVDGMDRFLRKPFSAEELQSLVRSLTMSHALAH